MSEPWVVSINPVYVALLALLRRLEWSGRSPYHPSTPIYCPVCWGRQPDHAPGCELEALADALEAAKEARVR